MLLRKPQASKHQDSMCEIREMYGVGCINRCLGHGMLIAHPLPTAHCPLLTAHYLVLSSTVSPAMCLHCLVRPRIILEALKYEGTVHTLGTELTHRSSYSLREPVVSLTLITSFSLPSYSHPFIPARDPRPLRPSCGNTHLSEHLTWSLIHVGRLTPITGRFSPGEMNHFQRLH